jgi:hypothetical protein
MINRCVPGGVGAMRLGGDAMTDGAIRKLHKKGWSGKDLTKEAITVRFGAPQLDAIDTLMDGIRARGLTFSQITKADFSHPDLDGFLADVLRRLKDGPGAR